MAQANSKAKITLAADQPPGMKYTKAAAGASMTKNTTKEMPYTIRVSYAAFFNLEGVALCIAAFWRVISLR